MHDHWATLDWDEPMYWRAMEDPLSWLQINVRRIFELCGSFIKKQIFSTENAQLYRYFLFIKAESRASIWKLYVGSSLLAYMGLLGDSEYKGNAVLSKISHNFNLLIFYLFI